MSTQEELQETFEESHQSGPCATCHRDAPGLIQWDERKTRIISFTYYAPNLPAALRSGKLSAKEFLREFLRNGPRPVKDIVAAAPVIYMTLVFTKGQLGITSERIDGVWHWRLPS